MKRQSTDVQKIFANHMSKIGLLPRIKNFQNSKQEHKLYNYKMAKDLNTHFTEEDRDGKIAHENTLTTIGHQGNAN